MGYALNQTPVPIWAAPNQSSLNINTNDLPSFLQPKDSDERSQTSSQTSSLEKPSFLKTTGRWNSVMNHYPDPEVQKYDQRRGGVDPSLLDLYDLNSKWENRMDVDTPEGGIAKLEKLKERFVKNLRGNPFFPILLRGSASACAIVTLGLACEVYVQTRKTLISLDDPVLGTHSPTASTIFCIVISTIATVYLLFSLWDETFGQPLGLRPSQSKIKFVAIDLLLICLTAANLAVAFDTMINKSFICPAIQNHYVCRLDKGVVSMIFVTLCVYFLTILVSTFRMIDRATH